MFKQAGGKRVAPDEIICNIYPENKAFDTSHLSSYEIIGLSCSFMKPQILWCSWIILAIQNISLRKPETTNFLTRNFSKALM